MGMPKKQHIGLSNSILEILKGNKNVEEKRCRV
jgi:hypothetical protein